MFLFLVLKTLGLVGTMILIISFFLSSQDPEFMNNYATHTHESVASVATADETE